MMKHFVVVISAAVVTSFMTGNVALAQSTQANPSPAGLTPDSSLYFLDRLGENLRQFFTFGAEAKAKLQIEFAGERVSEIKVMVEEKGPESKGIEIAKSLLVSNVAYAAEVINQEKTSGKDVTVLAKNLDDEFDAQEKLLEQTFKDAKERLKAERKNIKTKLLEEARLAGDTVRVAELEKQLALINQQVESLDQKKDQLKNAMEDEQKSIEKEMDANDKKNEEIEHEQDHQEELDEAKEEIEEAEAEEPQEAEELENKQDKTEAAESKNQKNEENNSSTTQEQGTSNRGEN